jgi:hypothetical protein
LVTGKGVFRWPTGIPISFGGPLESKFDVGYGAMEKRGKEKKKEIDERKGKKGRRGGDEESNCFRAVILRKGERPVP